MQYQQGLREMAVGNVAAAQRDMAMGQARMNMGRNEVAQGNFDRNLGVNEMRVGQMEYYNGARMF